MIGKHGRQVRLESSTWATGAHLTSKPLSSWVDQAKRSCPCTSVLPAGHKHSLTDVHMLTCDVLLIGNASSLKLIWTKNSNNLRRMCHCNYLIWRQLSTVHLTWECYNRHFAIKVLLCILKMPWSSRNLKLAWVSWDQQCCSFSSQLQMLLEVATLLQHLYLANLETVSQCLIFEPDSLPKNLPLHFPFSVPNQEQLAEAFFHPTTITQSPLRQCMLAWSS